ncbi:LPS assembly lipoprotein LptE [Oleiagrimonas sp.]|jgi:LPS-assembly lipoprotein|uniref:LPS-assembly lipoprotein LptE n=1 Tax=Oleiagrimonas sp. TaxID=2010330 RepID=UPI0026315FB8|nr:LPS assembly lipoprotein LptE [Oleiagrimonas sp.]MDA3914785.1 LPS assembly lipoprotein LptE [Oleiagrimonas sp.]
MKNMRFAVCVTVMLGLAACGFHLRRGASLPPSMQKVHLVVSGGGDLPRELARTLESSGATLVDESGPGVADFHVPTAVFTTQALTFTGRARVGEYAVHYRVAFHVTTHDGRSIVPRQHIDMTREFTYDAQQPIGTAAQTEQIHSSLVRDMVQAIQFRLRAAAEHPPASDTNAPAPSASASAGS